MFIASNDSKSESVQMTFQLIVCFLFISLFQIVALFGQSWYVLSININSCLNCGRIIVTMGTLIEHAMDELGGEAKNENISFGTAYKQYYNDNNLIYDNSYGNNGTDISQYDVNDTIFKIDNQIDMYGGLWRASLCTQDGRYCALVDTANSDVFHSLPLLRKLKERILVSRMLFLVTIAITISLTMLEILYGLMSLSIGSMTFFVTGLCSVVVSLIGVVTVALPFFNAEDISDIITVNTPWSLILMMLTSYVTLATVITIKKTRKTLRQNATRMSFKDTQNRVRLKNTYYTRRNIVHLIIQRFVKADQALQHKKMYHYV